MSRWGLLSAFAFALGFATVPSLALGHANLVSPTPRANENIKTAPCGAAPGSPVASYAPGEAVMIQWEETVDHPGHYRLTLSPNGVDGFPAIVLEDDIPDIDGPVPSGGRQFTRMETIPDQSCDRCTLQLVQSMEENPAQPTYYYSCADIRIGAGLGSDGGLTSGGGGDAAPEEDDDSPPVGPTPGVCSVAVRPSHSGPRRALALILGIPLAFVVFRPRIGAKVSNRGAGWR